MYPATATPETATDIPALKPCGVVVVMVTVVPDSVAPVGDAAIGTVVSTGQVPGRPVVHVGGAVPSAQPGIDVVAVKVSATGS